MGKATVVIVGIVLVACVLAGCGKAERHLYSGPPRPHGIIARTEESKTIVRVSTGALSRPIPLAKLPSHTYRLLPVEYTLEYKTGLRPFAVDISAEEMHPPQQGVGGGQVEGLGSDDVQSGMKEIFFLTGAKGPVAIKAAALTRFGTVVGEGQTTLVAP